MISVKIHHRVRRASFVCSQVPLSVILRHMHEKRGEPDITRVSAIIHTNETPNLDGFELEGQIPLGDSSILFVSWNSPDRIARMERDVTLPDPIDCASKLEELRREYDIRIVLLTPSLLQRLMLLQATVFTDYPTPLNETYIGVEHIVAVALQKGEIVASLVGTPIHFGSFKLVELDHGATLPSHRDKDLMVVLAHLIELEARKRFEEMRILVEAGTSFPSVNSCCAKFGMIPFGKMIAASILTVGEQDPGYETLKLWYK